MAKGMALVGLDVHARQRHAAVLSPDTGGLGVSRLGMAPVEVASFLGGLGPGVGAVYEAGPRGFGLARARARDRRARGGAGVDPEGARRPGQDRPPRRGPLGPPVGR